ncbi:MAG TPA: YacL family protein [Marinagarivorans sp.]
MEYEYTRDASELPAAYFSSGHSAFGRWLTDDVGEDSLMIDAILQATLQLELKVMSEKTFSSKSFRLTLDQEQVVIGAHTLATEPCRYDENEDLLDYQGTADFYDEELMAECGLTDFKAALTAWQEFIKA